MKLSVSYHGGTRYDIVSGKHRIVTDQPVADGGQDAGLSPVELFRRGCCRVVSGILSGNSAHGMKYPGRD